MFSRIVLCVLCLTIVGFAQSGSKNIDRSRNLITVANNTEADARATATPATTIEFRLLATNKTSTMQKEMNEAADAGFHFEGTMGGETSFGGSEVVTIMSRNTATDTKKRYEYKLLATSRTSTMQRELQQAGDAGFEYKGQSVYSSTFGGKEVVVILERDLEGRRMKWEYKLLATKKTSTMEKELNEAGREGFLFVGVTVADTADRKSVV